MKTKLIVSLALLAGSPLFAADADLQAEVEKAAKALAAKPNYSWVTKSENNGTGQNFRMGPTRGQTEKGGAIHIKSQFGDTEFEMVRKGEKGAMMRDGEWQSADELDQETRNEWIARRIRSLQAPAKDVEDLVDLTTDLKKGDGGVYSGKLTMEGIKEVMSRVGRRAPNLPEDSKGTVKFWVKDGVLTKYEHHITTKLTVRETEVEVDRTTTTEISDVGTTKLSLPDPATKKLE